jgi:peptide/nickel transport system substrate-binding protein
MANKQSYFQEAADYWREQQWRQRLMAARVPRSLVVKGTTLLALGGAGAVNQILAACAASAGREGVTKEISTEGSYKWSKFPYIEKYNFRNLPWPTTPYWDGVHARSGGGNASWDVFRNGLQSEFVWDTLRNKRYGADVNMLNEELKDNLASVAPAPDYSYHDYHIRPGIYFHDVPPVNGRLFTAEDVAYCLERYRTDSLHSAPLFVIDRIEVLPDKETVRVYLKRPILYLDHILASNDYWMVAREHAEGDKNFFQQQPIGTGPFRVVKTEYLVGLEAVRHPGFGRRDPRWPDYPLPFMRGVKYTYAVTTAAVAAYRSGQSDIWNVIMAFNEFEDILTTNPDSIIQIHAPNSTYSAPWGLNLQNPPLNDVRVRRALNMAINRPEMIDVVWGGFASAQYPMGYAFQGYTEPLMPEDLGPWYQYNPEKAKELLAEAGYPNGFEMEYMLGTTLADDDIVVIKYLEAIGVRVKLVQVESTVLSANRNAKKFNHAIITGLSATGWTAVKNAFEFWSPDSQKNYGGINDPVMLDLLDRAAYTLDWDEQVQLIRQMNQRALDQAYYLLKVVGYYVFFRRPWMNNVASAIQGQFQAWGTVQVAVAWNDDTAPEERKGHLKT